MTHDQAKCIYVDPSYKAYYEDRLFDQTNPVLNRDDTLAPFIRLRVALKQQGIDLHTADFLVQRESQDRFCDYYSLGELENYEQLKARDDVRLQAFVIFEPPVVDPRLYRALPELTATFDRVYVHNTEGDGYSLDGVDQSKLRKFYWPQPHKDVLTGFWNRDERFHRTVMINGNHKPVSYNSELYSKRIEALTTLSKYGSVDLYGRGWERWWSRNSMWFPYWRNRRTLMSIYKGTCASKYEVLSHYDFALCFENMAMKGYVTEKIFDCLYAGTIPLYLGAKDITDLIPENAYIDCTKFTSWDEMHDKVMKMTIAETQSMRAAGRAFIQSEKGLKYYNSLIPIFQE
jgi:hypothetical protein